jgi:hypothetical protein
VGGFDGAAYLDCTERLDPRADRWGLLASWLCFSQ